MGEVVMIPVNSSNIESIGYDEAMQKLVVRFSNGSLYQYLNVPSVEFENLKIAPSIGSYLNRNIKGVYPFEKIG